MKLSARAALLVVLASSGVGAGISAADAATLTPAQISGAEQQAATTRVPMDVPLGSAMTALTGQTSHAGVHGSLPGAPLGAPAPTARDPHSLLPDPLVPPLTAAQGTPGLDLSAPLPAAGDVLRQDAASVALPETLMHANGAAATLGKPLTYTGDQSGRDGQSPQLDLNRLDPALLGPSLQSAPTGDVALDQRATEERPGHSAADLLATTLATTDALRG